MAPKTSARPRPARRYAPGTLIAAGFATTEILSRFRVGTSLLRRSRPSSSRLRSTLQQWRFGGVPLAACSRESGARVDGRSRGRARWRAASCRGRCRRPAHEESWWEQSPSVRRDPLRGGHVSACVVRRPLWLPLRPAPVPASPLRWRSEMRSHGSWTGSSPRT